MRKSVAVSIHLGFWIILFFIIYYKECNSRAELHEIRRMFARTINTPELQKQTGWTFSPKVLADYNPYLNAEIFKRELKEIGKMFIPFYLSFFLLPIFIKRKKLFLLPFIFSVVLYFYSVISAGNDTYRFLDSAFTIVFLSCFIALGWLFRILTEWFKNIKIKNQLEKQNLQSELTLLKNQISPHFLFNTLNNIDSLIKSNCDKASETLVKLSEIMRYMIYDTNTDKVELSNEIKYLENYIDLQKIQYANKELVSLSVNGKVETVLIAPMLFIPFIENAFKHCTDKSIQNAISIAFSIYNSLVMFECVNVFDKARKITKDNASGIGLNIIKRRLEIIYPKRHKLYISEENNIFKVTLSLIVNEY